MMILRLVFAAVALTLMAVEAQAEDERPWEEKFNEVYRLNEGEVLKRIAPPFIPERLDYYRNENRSQAHRIKEPPTYFNFHWRDEKLKSWGYGFIGSAGLTLDRVLHTILQLPRYESEGPKELMSIKLPGDWIVRPEAPVEQKLQAVAQMVKDETSTVIQFQQQNLPRSVIVVGGTFTAETRDEEGRMQDIQLYSEKQDDTEGGGGGSGTMEEFITRIGDLASMPTAIETPSRLIGTVSWRTHRDSSISRAPAGPERDEKLKLLLQHAAEQTGLEFKIEQREVSVWVVSEAEN